MRVCTHLNISYKCVCVCVLYRKKKKTLKTKLKAVCQIPFSTKKKTIIYI